jgi:hypothetical protein
MFEGRIPIISPATHFKLGSKNMELSFGVISALSLDIYVRGKPKKLIVPKFARILFPPETV